MRREVRPIESSQRRERIAALAEAGHGAALGSVVLGIIVGLFAATEAGDREPAEA